MGSTAASAAASRCVHRVHLGDAVQGRLTEAEERIGDITVGGTIGLVVFVGLFGGLLGGAVYLLVRRWPRRRPGRLGSSSGHLRSAWRRGSRRSIRTAWISTCCGRTGSPSRMLVAVFLLYGMTIASVMERADRSWPVIEVRPLAVAAHLPILVLLPVSLPGVVFLSLLLLVLLVQHVEPLARLAGAGAWISAVERSSPRRRSALWRCGRT